MRSLPKVTFVIDDFTLGSPGQQLLDRFLIGYNRNGDFYSPGCAVDLLATALEARVKDFGLKHAANLDQAQAVVIVGAAAQRLPKLPRGARCFVYGTIAETASQATDLLKIVEAGEMALRAQTAVAGAFPLPVIEAPKRTRQALAVNFGPFPQADLDAVEALWTFAAPNKTGSKVQLLTGPAVWRNAYSTDWSELFAAAFSRSNTIQGDPEKDGRTQDVSGLRLVEKLVTEPRVWLIDEPDGARLAVFVMNGALEDLNIALQGASGKIVSTQLYRPPPPMLDHFSELAGQIEDFFRQETAPALSPTLVALPAVLDSMRAARQGQA